MASPCFGGGDVKDAFATVRAEGRDDDILLCAECLAGPPEEFAALTMRLRRHVQPHHGPAATLDLRCTVSSPSFSIVMASLRELVGAEQGPLSPLRQPDA